jgi:two-component system, NarL family, invasion response regulator UvrY
MMMRVLIADDHPVVRRGVRQTLTEEFTDCEVIESPTAAELLSLVRSGVWSVIILDISLPDRNGLDVLKELQSDYPEIPVVVLSMHPEDQFAARMMRAGASAYVTKESASEELAQAVRLAMTGRKYMSPALTEKLALEAVMDDGSRSPVLSDRELQVLCLIAEGKGLSEIADVLILSVKTVSTYRSRLLEKLNARTNADLVHYAFTHGYVRK